MRQVELGNSGIRVSRVAYGTGTNGFQGSSNEGKLGVDALATLLRYAYDRGVTFWDTADDYGTHAHLRAALQGIPRDNVTILTKSYSPDGVETAANVERYCRELNTNYLDVALLHCVMDADWPNQRAGAMQALTEARERGLVRAVGVSCHSQAALEVAAMHPWVQVIMVRLNYAGEHMDVSPDQVLPVLRQAHAAGKGIFGMKVLGQGALAHDPERGLRYILAQECVDAFSIGMMNQEQVDQNVALVGED